MADTSLSGSTPGTGENAAADFPECSAVFPPAVYTVANDLELKRNYSVRLYLDHMLDGLGKEYDIRFPNGRLDWDFFSPVKITSPSAEDPGIVYNRGRPALRRSNASPSV